MNRQNLQQRSVMTSMIKTVQIMVKAASIKFETKNIKSSLCDYSDAYILVTGDIIARSVNATTDVAFTNCA